MKALLPCEFTGLTKLLRRAEQGDPEAPGELFASHRERLHRMIDLRLDSRLRGRLDASDVLQEAYLEFARSLAGYLRNPEVPFFLWLRFITCRKLQALHRHHLGVHGRDAHREISRCPDALSQASSVSLAAEFLGHGTSPSQAAVRAELQVRIQDALDSMETIDREVLALRHFEQLSNGETAKVLGLSEAAASNRYVRALRRLKEALLVAPGPFDWPATENRRPERCRSCS